MTWAENIHPDIDALVEALATALEAEIRVGLAMRGRAVLALAGGRTPLPVYERLANAALDWSKVALLASDERWVSDDHRARNERELREAFANASGLQILPLIPATAGQHVSPEAALATLTTIAEPFDAVLLGMGADGHFASLFPGAAELAAGLDPHNPNDTLVVHPDPLPTGAPFARISLSKARLLRTRRLLLAITGEAKRAVLHRAQTALDPLTLPISALLHDPSVQVEIHWSP